MYNNTNIYSVLNNDDDEDEYEYEYTKNEEIYIEIDLKIVDSLYSYFTDKGLSDKVQFRAAPQNWRIEKHHIHSALIRNKGDINAAGKELDEMINNDKFEIRTFYAKLKYGEYIHKKTQPYKKPYLSDQEWQIKPKNGMYLVYKHKVFKISCIYAYNIELDRILTNDCCDMTINLKDFDVKYGEFKFIDSKNIHEYLEKEYYHLKDELQKLSKENTKWVESFSPRVQKIKDKITIITKEHERNCTSESKILAMNIPVLPINLIQKIKSYGIESNCSHMYTISYLEEDLDELYDDLDDGYKPYVLLKWEIEIATHILEGDYEEWLECDYY